MRNEKQSCEWLSNQAQRCRHVNVLTMFNAAVPIMSVHQIIFRCAKWLQLNSGKQIFHALDVSCCSGPYDHSKHFTNINFLYAHDQPVSLTISTTFTHGCFRISRSSGRTWICNPKVIGLNQGSSPQLLPDSGRKPPQGMNHPRANVMKEY